MNAVNPDGDRRLEFYQRGELMNTADQPSRIEPSSGFAEVNGTRLYYEVAGSGHPLVLIHGFSLDTRMWDDQFETFAQYYQVVRYDARGFGKSAVPTAESYSEAGDLNALMEHLGIAQAYVLGHSLGGGTAINFALSYPDATDALVLVGSILGGFNWVEMGSTLDAIWSAGKESGVEEARELWLGSAWFSPALENPGVASRLTRIVSEYSGWDWENDDPSVSLEPPAIGRLDGMRAPTLVVVGERDTSDNHTIADTLQQRIPNARKVIMPRVGHMANMEDRESFNDIVLAFLAEISSAT